MLKIIPDFKTPHFQARRFETEVTVGKNDVT